MIRRTSSVRLASTLLLLGAAAGELAAQSGPPPMPPAIAPTQTIQLWNGRDFTGFYTWLPDFGYTDPERMFTVVDQVDGAPAIRVSGKHWGGFITNQSYKDYHLVMEFRWGAATWGDRKNGARDNGILYHASGREGSPQQNFLSPWMHSLEYQIIEGGTGDFIMVRGFGPDGQRMPASVSATIRLDRDGEKVWDPRGQKEVVTTGRINWFGRDPDWWDRIGFRGGGEIERPAGEWNTAEIIARGTDVTHMLNGVVVLQLTDVNPSEGRLFFQSEGAEMFIRKIELRPLQ